jgi:hypothetical protein
MTVVQALPSHGDVFFDVRDDGRSLRVNWHSDQDLAVLSTWRHGSCVATCHVARADVPSLVAQLVNGLAISPNQAWAPVTYVNFGKRRRWSRLAASAAERMRRPTT